MCFLMLCEEASIGTIERTSVLCLPEPLLEALQKRLCQVSRKRRPQVAGAHKQCLHGLRSPLRSCNARRRCSSIGLGPGSMSWLPAMLWAWASISTSGGSPPECEAPWVLHSGPEHAYRCCSNEDSRWSAILPAVSVNEMRISLKTAATCWILPCQLPLAGLFICS